MSFWKKVGKFAAQAAEKGIEAAKEHQENLEQTKESLRRLSDDELKNRFEKATNTTKTAIKYVMAERGYNVKGVSTEQAQRSLEKARARGHEDDQASPGFRKGDDAANKTAVVLSAPGQEEEKAGRPAAGQTGKNLQSAVEELNRRDPERFPSSNIDDYTLINASESVYYKSKNGKTEAHDDEITDPSNLKRVSESLKGMERVVALGDKAQSAVKASDFEGEVYKSGHPSMQSINRTYHSDEADSSERHKDRMRQWAGDIDKE